MMKPTLKSVCTEDGYKHFRKMFDAKDRAMTLGWHPAMRSKPQQQNKMSTR